MTPTPKDVYDYLVSIGFVDKSNNTFEDIEHDMTLIAEWHQRQVSKAHLEGLVKGASIAAEEVNRELGLELTLNGHYYLNRSSKENTNAPK